MSYEVFLWISRGVLRLVLTVLGCVLLAAIGYLIIAEVMLTTPFHALDPQP
ncbi:hypothetical protein [Rhodanobacter sp. B04]|uniref:hypothetical protein n=1 Tax=Rhodanobacter sp. B04 TaxID=1945860 RepID=UPI0014399F65|nr:hypothetical protein [Rhodanobacter sp. B04]